MGYPTRSNQFFFIVGQPSRSWRCFDDLPTSMINDIRYKSLSTRVTECSGCLQRTICPPCSVFAYYQRCQLCKYSQVCPKCVAEGALMTFLGVSQVEMINPFLKIFGQPGVGVEAEPSSSVSTASEIKPMLLWRCNLHLSIELEE